MTDDVIELARPECVEKRPTLGLHLLVKNGRSVIPRLINCVGPYLDEVVAVLNDCSDDTLEVLVAECGSRGIRLQMFEVTSQLNPDLYADDVPATYEVGDSLCGEVYPGPFTEGKMLVEWAAARNVGWHAGTADFRLHLDADDVVDDPHCLPGLCQLMDQKGLDAVATRYHYAHTGTGISRADAFRERIARNLPEITWHGAIHESLRGIGPGRAAAIDGNLVVRDLRDSDGAGIRMPHRNLKVLYRAARLRDWQITTREMVYLAAEAKPVMPKLSERLLEMCIAMSRWDEERAWAAALMGELSEVAGEYRVASGWYERSLEIHSGVMSALRLSRVSFHLQDWEGCVKAYEQAMANKGKPQLLDGGIVYEDATRVLVASALRRLGRATEAAQLASDVQGRHGDSPALDQLTEKLRKDADRLG